MKDQIVKRIVIEVDNEGGTTLKEINRDIQKLGKTTDKVSKSFEGDIKKMSKSVDGFHKTISRLKGAFIAGFGMIVSGMLGRQIIETSNAFNQYRTALETLEGSHKAATERWEQLLQFAQDTPFRINQVMESYKLMKAYGLDPTISAMRALGDTAAVMGNDALPRLALALGQIKGAGKVMMQDLLQMSNAGINVNDVLKTSFNISRNELDKLNKAVASGVLKIEDVYDAFIGYMQEKFGGQMAKLNASLKGQWERLVNILQKTSDKVMKGGLEKGMTVLLKVTGDWLEQFKVSTETWKTWGKVGSAALSLILEGLKDLEKAIRGIVLLWDMMRVAFWKFVDDYSEGLGRLGRENAKFYRDLAQKALDAGWQDTSRALTGLSKAFLGMAEAAKTAKTNLQEAQEAVTKDLDVLSDDKNLWVNKAVERLKKGAKELEELKAKAAAQKGKKQGLIYDVSGFGSGSETDKEAKNLEKIANSLRRIKNSLKIGGLTGSTAALERVRQKYESIRLEAEKLYKQSPQKFQEMFGSWESFMSSWTNSYEKAQKKAVSSTEKAAKDSSQFWIKAMRSMQQASSEFFLKIMQGNFKGLLSSFQQMVNKMLADWAAAQLQMALWGQGGKEGLIMKAIGWAGSLLGGWLGSGMAGMASTNAGAVNMNTGAGWAANYDIVSSTEQASFDVPWYASSYHGGGRVGVTSVPKRLVPGYLFANAPRLHDGLKPWEYPAILRYDEDVRTPEQRKEDEKKQQRPATENTTVINIYALDGKSVEDVLMKYSGQLMTNSTFAGIRRF